MEEIRKDYPKQVIVMRSDLGMRRGKQIAQGAHASMKVILDMMNKLTIEGGDTELTLKIVNGSALGEWLNGSFTKVCAKCTSEEELLDLYNAAQKVGLPVVLITDAGRTEFNGVPTNTCICIGPASANKIDKITGHLKLL